MNCTRFAGLFCIKSLPTIKRKTTSPSDREYNTNSKKQKPSKTLKTIASNSRIRFTVETNQQISGMRKQIISKSIAITKPARRMQRAQASKLQQQQQQQRQNSPKTAIFKYKSIRIGSKLKRNELHGMASNSTVLVGGKGEMVWLGRAVTMFALI